VGVYCGGGGFVKVSIWEVWWVDILFIVVSLGRGYVV